MSNSWLDARWPWILAAVILVGVYVASWVGVREADPRPEGVVEDIPNLAERDDVNVLFILIDTLRSHRLGSYGYERETSPTLDYLAQTGVRFSRQLAQSSWTKASMASLWTGISPTRTGVSRFDHSLSEEALMPAEVLQEAGFRTAGIWRNGWVDPIFGFSQGFELYENPRPGRPPASVLRDSPHITLDGTDRDVVRATTEFLRAFGDQRWFLYVHLMDVHQYIYDESTAIFGSDYSDIYDNSVRHVDDVVTELLLLISEHGGLDETLVAIAVDHGEAFGERGIEGHAKHVYRETTEVPFILSLPFRLDSGITVETRSRNLDIWPTLLDIVGLPPLPDADGRSMLPEILAAGMGETETEDSRPAFAHLDRTWGRPRNASRILKAVTLGEHRLVRTAELDGVESEELFDASIDRLESQDLKEDQPEVAEHLRGLLDDYLERTTPPWGDVSSTVELDEMRLNQLRALGYEIP